MNSMSTWVDPFLRELLGRGEPLESPAETRLPPVDIVESAEAYQVRIDMPGVSDKGVEVTLENGILSVAGHPAAEEEKGETVLAERAHGDFRRSFRLGEGRVDAAGIAAAVKNGVLSLTLPKAAGAKTRRIPVQGQ